MVYGQVAGAYATKVHVAPASGATERRATDGRAADAVITAAVLAEAAPRRRLPPAALVKPQIVAFSRVALAAAAVTVATGTGNAWMRITGADPGAGIAARWATLTSSAYGWLLVAKLALVLVVVAVGAVNWRRNTPRLALPDGMAALDGATRLELGVAVAVLALSAALAVTSPPGTE